MSSSESPEEKKTAVAVSARDCCIEQFKQCLALIIPSLRRGNNNQVGGYHDPNDPSKGEPTRSLKKKKYQKLDNPGSVNFFQFVKLKVDLGW